MQKTIGDGIILTKYDDSLAATLADMWNKSNENWGGSGDIQTPQMEINRHKTGSYLDVYVALHDGTAVGYCSLEKYFADDNTLYISLLNVRPDYMGKKIGKAMVLECVERTIELGYPRLDLHTWTGNVEAVPLYKKCGFLWEDRSDSTHLVNFIPEIMGIFGDYFAEVDWYNHSTRSLNIQPDGTKLGDFEFFDYTWEHNGKTLVVGYERSGRRIRKIETNDYAIEFFADDHELAFGLSYGCKFVVTKKTDASLDIQIIGKHDKNIAFEFDQHITQSGEYSGSFFVGEVTKPQGKWKVHPTVCAEVIINGKSMTFGLGINPRYPVQVELSLETELPLPGMDIPTHLNIRSFLPCDATISFIMPKNNLSDFPQEMQSVFLKKGERKSIPITNKIKTPGYECIEAEYFIKGESVDFSFKKKEHYYLMGLTSMYAYETDTTHGIACGPWKLVLSKNSNEAWIENILNSAYGGFDPPKFGKPYDDEFQTVTPDISSYKLGDEMLMCATYTSAKFPGLICTQIFSLSQTGIITRRNLVKNVSSSVQDMCLCDTYYFDLRTNTVFSLNNELFTNRTPQSPDGLIHGLSNIETDDITENWIFEADPAAPRGYCWPKDLKPNFKWGECAMFEYAATLQPGEEFETEKIMYVYGLFHNFMAFRNFAQGIYDTSLPILKKRVEYEINNYNAFIPNDMCEVSIINNCESILEGDVTVSSDGLFDTEIQTNPPDEETESNDFEFELHPTNEPLHIIKIQMDFATYQKTVHRTVFLPKGDLQKTMDGSSLVISNGIITFKADPAYSHGVYSLVCADEWLLHKYPSHDAYAWWNPFIGGIKIMPPNMNSRSVLKETITAEFTSITDCFGNTWEGICTTLTISEDKDLKGAVVQSYYVTLPGVPVLCSFFKLYNGIGSYKTIDILHEALIHVSDDEQSGYADFTNTKGQAVVLKLGASDTHGIFDKVVRFRSDRKNMLYIYHDATAYEVEGDNKYEAGTDLHFEIKLPDGKTHTSKPIFFVLTDKDIPAGGLDDLDRVRFNDN